MVKAMLKRDVTAFYEAAGKVVMRSALMPKGTVVTVYGGQTLSRAGSHHVAVSRDIGSDCGQQMWVPWSALTFLSRTGEGR